MKKYMPLLLILAVGCGQQGAVESTIKERLKDPNSARFERVVFNKAGDRACAVWNAKNSFGGYGEWTSSELSKEVGYWVITRLEGSPYDCARFEALNEAIEAGDALRETYKNLSPETKKTLAEEAENSEEGKQQQAQDKSLQEQVRNMESK